MADTEIWKDIPGYESLYQASNIGKVRSFDRKTSDGRFVKGRILKNRNSSVRNGTPQYLSIMLYKDNDGGKQFLIHRIIALTFCKNDNLEIYNQVNHIDGNKKNNHSANLEWCNNSLNQIHSCKMGLKNMAGINHPKHKLKEEDILFIRSNNGLTSKQLSNRFNIQMNSIRHIIKGNTWKHLKQQSNG